MFLKQLQTVNNYFILIEKNAFNFLAFDATNVNTIVCLNYTKIKHK